jgi:leucyl aminopeptidase
MSRAVIVRSDFNPIPSAARARAVDITVTDVIPVDAGAVGVPAGTGGEPSDVLGLSRAALSSGGFEGNVAQTLTVPAADGRLRVAVGIGDVKALSAAGLRDAAAAFACAAARYPRLAFMLGDLADIDPATAAQALVEGILLARYSYDPLKREPAAVPVESIAFAATAAQRTAATAGATRGHLMASATMLARDLANTPPAHLTAVRMAEVAADIAAQSGLEVEVFDREALVRLGCGGLIGVNGGSAEEPRMIRLRYHPAASGDQAVLRLVLVAKGIMYDSGGLSLKPADAVHATMKNDMSGAAAVLAAMSVLRELGCPAAVTGYLMCTDNVPSGTALRLGDVITIHGGTTVEVLNTDAEGRLVMADALVMAAEERPDAIVDIATLTGACLRALGTSMAGVLGSSVNAGSITAALFLAEFTGDVPWAHIDMAGTAQVDAPQAWRTKGCSGFGARLLTELALNFTSG